MYYKTWILILISLLLLPLASAETLFGRGGETERLSRASSPARLDHMSSLGGGSRRITFQFGEMRAWLNEDGDWQIHGQVNHSALRCAHYEVGLRFGEGHPGCTDVNWLTEVQYVTRQRQCNSATALHEGGEYKNPIRADFNRVTCAERVIRCRGKCK
jgi:hypothetical protein